ncbi:MAG: TonB-dependent receptor, partial [Acidobacteriota bacterium]
MIRAVLCAILWTAVKVSAQQADGPLSPATPEASLFGDVRDASGLVLPGATVGLTAARGSDTDPDRSTVTAPDGSFEFSRLRPGPYHLVVQFPGFTPSEQDILVGSRASEPLRVVLALSGLEEHVSVAASTARPLNAAMQTNVDRRLIETLAAQSVGTGLSSVITMTTPGVAADSNGGFHPLGEHAETSFIVDGQPITDQQSRAFSNQLSPITIASLEAVTGVPAAEFGDKTSLVVAITTRSGLDNPHRSGAASFGYGSFATGTGALTYGAGAPRAGIFLAIDAANSGRFLDTPEHTPLHAHGRSVNLFGRLDRRVSPATAVQLNAAVARAVFQAPNTFDQDANGQDQQQRLGTVNVAPSLRRTVRGRGFVETNVWFRRDVAYYDPSADPLDDRPATLSQRRTLTNAGAKAAWSYAARGHVAKVGVQETTTWLTEAFRTGVTDAAFNSPCVEVGGDPAADPSLRDPRQCDGAGLAVNSGFLPALVPYDVTRGGAFFDFQADGRIVQWAAYAQDRWQLRGLGVTAGLRFDVYDGLSRATGVQPRVGLVHRLGRTGTVLRAAYGRVFLTPYAENLVLASSTGSGGFGGGLLGSVGGAPLTPGRRHQVDVGVGQRLWKGIQIDAEYFRKMTDGAFDFGVVFNTPLAFPVQFRASTHQGMLVHVTAPEYRGWRAYATLSHTRARLFGPELGGLRFSADYAPVAAPDHDQPFQQTTHLDYRSTGAHGWWGGLTWRYDSGLVAVAVPTYAAALRLTGDEQAAMGLFCGGTPATREAPLRSCVAPTFGATR